MFKKPLQKQQIKPISQQIQPKAQETPQQEEQQTPQEQQKPEAHIKVSKHKAQILLESLNSYTNKNDPIYKELIHELNDIIKYWDIISSLEIKNTKAEMMKYLSDAKVLRKQQKLTGEAAKRYMQKRGKI